MSTNIVDISSKIASMLSTITELNGVYEYIPALNESYPYATITLNEITGAFGDTIRNSRNYIFNIDLYLERTSANAGNQNSETLFRTILDSIITMFDNNTTLDGLVQMVNPVEISTEIQDTDIGDTRVARIIVDCLKMVDSIT